MEKILTAAILLLTTLSAAIFTNIHTTMEDTSAYITSAELEADKPTARVILIRDDMSDETSAVEEPLSGGIHMTVRAFGYDACVACCGKDDGITSTGTLATPGRTVAVDPTVIPYGSRIIIDGKTYIAEDCGGSIKGAAIDIFFGSHEEALNWGIRMIDIIVLSAEAAK